MNKQILKKIRDNIPEPIKILAGSLFRNKLIKNSIYKEYKNKLVRKDSQSNLDNDKFQLNELKEILIHSYKHVPYYTKLFDSLGFNVNNVKSFGDIEVIPFLTKKIIIENFNDLISTKKIPNGFYEAYTGGSTGEPLKILLDYDGVFKVNAFINHYRSKLNYIESDKLVTFRGVQFKGKLWKHSPMQNELIMSPFGLSKDTIKDYVSRINKYKPHFLNGYLSSIYYFAKLLSDNQLHLDIKLKGVFLISETIDKEQREFVEYFFNVKSKTFYGLSESCILAEEVASNLYRFDSLFGYTEFLPCKEGNFSIIGTGFLNKTMPLIRYKTDDVCIEKDGQFLIEGKRISTDGLYGSNGEFISQAAFNIHSSVMKNILKYQFVQKNKGKTQLSIIVNKNFRDSEKEDIHNYINSKLDGVIEFQIEVVKSLILSKRGKFKMIIRTEE